MKNEIFTSLINYGFQRKNDGYIKEINNNFFQVFSKENTVYLSVDKSYLTKEEKNLVLDKIESISKKYGITSAGFSGNKPYLVLSPPSDNISEEVKRIRYLVINLNKILFESQSDDIKVNFNTTDKVNEIHDIKEDNIDKLNEDKDKNNDNSNETIYRATAARGSRTYGAYGYTKDDKGNKNSGSDMTNEGYSHTETNKYISDLKKKKEISYLDEPEISSHNLGVLGSMLGAFLALILITLLHKIGFIGSLFAFIIGLLIYFGYKKLSKMEVVPYMPSIIFIITTAILLVLLMNSIEIGEAYGYSTLKSFGSSLESFVNNSKFDIIATYERLLFSIGLGLLGFIVPKFILERNKMD